MRRLQRNMQEFYYSNYLGREEIKDKYGNATGEFKIKYSEPQLAKGNISASRGSSQADQFGVSVNYSKTLVSSQSLDLSETSILWIDVIPVIENGETATPYNYKVVEVAKSINEVSYAIQRVDVK